MRKGWKGTAVILGIALLAAALFTWRCVRRKITTNKEVKHMKRNRKRYLPCCWHWPWCCVWPPPHGQRREAELRGETELW